jgi:hypothetical protein
VDEKAFATLLAVVAVPAEPADGDTIADREVFNARTDFGDLSGDFMPRGQRPRQAGEFTGDEVRVGPAYTAGTDTDAHFGARRRRCRNIGELQRRARGLYVDCFM